MVQPEAVQATPSTKVDSKTVRGRRSLQFRSLEEVVADAEMLVASPQVKTLGNWSLGQLLAHLGGAINVSIDGISVKVSWYRRLMGMFLKGRVINKGMPAGIQLPKEREPIAFPKGVTAEEGLERLRKAVARSQRERMTARHPVFGKLTHEEWNQLHLRHAELHLSFAIPT
jgi:hypothetical protein